MSAHTNQQICCRFCDAPIRPGAAGDPNSNVGCIACDNWTSAEEVIALLEMFASSDTGREVEWWRFAPFKMQTVEHHRYQVIEGGKR